MSSTNHTTNYNLPQFLGSDKPAWLGDINPAMSAIDTAMHNNAVKAQQGVDDASTAQGRANDAYNLADGAKTDAGTAQGTANTAIANAATVAQNLDNFEKKFNLISFTTCNNLAHTGGTITGQFTLAQNSDGSIFKFYGKMQVNGSSSLNYTTAVAGLSGAYGIPTGCFLTSAPDEAYFIDCAGTYAKITESNCLGVGEMNLAVGTDGQVYAFATTWSGSENVGSGQFLRLFYPPCVYFNKNFGDTPAPQE